MLFAFIHFYVTMYASARELNSSGSVFVMSTDLSSVVYVDPTTSYDTPHRVDVLTAHPARNNGACYGTIGAVRGANFDGTGISNDGRSVAVCIRPGDEQAVLAALGNVLRGNHPWDEDADRTAVTTTAQLGVLRNLVAAGDQDGALGIIDKLIAAAMAVVDRPLFGAMYDL